MSIPAPLPSSLVEDHWAVTDRELAWATLSPDAKHERILCAAGHVFTTEGLDAPMPAVAAAAGAGIGSLYRQFPSKRELLAALVIRRLDQITALAEAAVADGGDRWSALTGMLRDRRRPSMGRRLPRRGVAAGLRSSGCRGRPRRAQEVLEQLLADARAEGRLRADATTLDIRLLFTATRAAKQVEPEAWERMLTLLIDALDTGDAAVRSAD